MQFFFGGGGGAAHWRACRHVQASKVDMCAMAARLMCRPRARRVSVAQKTAAPQASALAKQHQQRGALYKRVRVDDVDEIMRREERITPLTISRGEMTAPRLQLKQPAALSFVKPAKLPPPSALPPLKRHEPASPLSIESAPLTTTATTAVPSAATPDDVHIKSLNLARARVAQLEEEVNVRSLPLPNKGTCVLPLEL